MKARSEEASGFSRRKDLHLAKSRPGNDAKCLFDPDQRWLKVKAYSEKDIDWDFGSTALLFKTAWSRNIKSRTVP